MARGVEQRTYHGLSRLLYGSRERIAGTIYGTVVVLGVLAAGSESSSIDAWELDVIMVATVVVLWVAHLYAHAIAESLNAGRRLQWAGVSELGRREFSIVLAAFLPALALLLGAVGIVSDANAVWLALVLGTITLAVQGLRYARMADLGIPATLLVVGVNLALGLVIVALKAALDH
jgi:hypothetical protein